jgi:hypothetical protein
MTKRLFVTIVLVANACGLSQDRDSENLSARPSCSAGLGVLYLSARDVVNYVNSTASPGERVPQFRAVADFFVSASYPLSESIILKAEYAYESGSYSVTSFFGQTQYGIGVHAPSIILEYLLAGRGVYELKIGAGAGIHFGSLTTTIVEQITSYTAHGAGFLVEFEGNTALSEHLYAYLGGSVRWDLIGELESETGGRPLETGTPVTLHFFGVSGRLGLSYFF